MCKDIQYYYIYVSISPVVVVVTVISEVECRQMCCLCDVHIGGRANCDFADMNSVHSSSPVISANPVC